LGASQTPDLFAAGRIGIIPGWFMILVVLVFYGLGLGLALWVARYRLEDD
jgi:uncharacterized membrane protein